MEQATITLTSGYQVAIVYSRTFGEMDIALALMILCALYALRWCYDVTYSLWMGRRRG